MKLIIDIPDNEYKQNKHYYDSVCHGIPLDDVKAEFINRYPTNWAGEPELGGASCHFSLNKVLQILDNIGKESEE